MKNIAIVYGGDSSEVEVSEKSAQGVFSFIDKKKFVAIPVLLMYNKWVAKIDNKEYPIDKNDFSFIDGDNKKIKFDCAYVTIHGTPGEDGRLQGYFDMIKMPYTTCGVLAASISFNKFTCNNYLRGFGVSVADSLLIRRNFNYSVSDIIKTLELPCFVKPNAGGSSFGITKVQKEEELETAIKTAFTESDEVIIEKYMPGREFTCGLYKIKGKETIFPVTEVITENDFFDYEAKYNADKATEITPADIPQETSYRMKKIASIIYDMLGCKGIIRVDFILQDNSIFLLEVNTTPGMTTTSFIPQQIRAANLDITQIFTEIIEDSIING